MFSTEQLSHRYTLEEYLNCTNISHDSLYELENGQIRSMPPESWQNLQIIMYLITEITKTIPYQQVTNKAEIIISGSRVTARVPDLVVLTPEGVAELAAYKRSTIILDMPPPLLVVEVVSPGKKNRDRDYRYKRSEYAARGITYYWIIDPQDKKFICLELNDGLYEEIVFGDSQDVISLSFPFELKIEFAKIFFE
ncbi:MAG: Uma2 family endonuclease [Pleurocapsa minor HA4230-MV1]|nr:Uma2 family endonuclease [Pleurocapsa minor HA4230-MV1]